MANMYGKEQGGAENTYWRVASYARLSKEDGGGAPSNSIDAQCKIISDWVQQQAGAALVAAYVDDGYSGATFERPGFQQMMHDAQTGAFNTIVVKDLSRFGRSYLDCGNWIERELPRMGVRLYSIGDAFDSMQNWDFNMALLVPMKNLMNEMQVLTTSEKVRASLAAKRARGEFVANYAPYGYAKSAADKHQLVVDEGAAAVVRQIFAWFLAGTSAAGIARALNERGVPSPAAYRQAAHSSYKTNFCGSTQAGPGVDACDSASAGVSADRDMGAGLGAGSCAWHAASVLRILRNETYTGTLVQGKTQRVGCRTNVRQHVPVCDWQRCAGAHEAIIGTRDFLQVQELLDTKS